MKTLQMLWHNKQAMLTLDSFQSWLVTGGADSIINVWTIIKDNLEHHSTLERHSATVNKLKFHSSTGRLASASDDYSILIWKLKETEWIVAQALRGSSLFI